MTTRILKLLLATAILATLSSLLGLYNTMRHITNDNGNRAVWKEQIKNNDKQQEEIEMLINR